MNETGIIFVSCKDSLALNIIYQQICPKIGKGTKKYLKSKSLITKDGKPTDASLCEECKQINTTTVQETLLQYESFLFV